MVGTSKTDTKTWNDTPSGSIISQLGAGAVRTDSIWEMSVQNTSFPSKTTKTGRSRSVVYVTARGDQDASVSSTN
jgi:hypothetical protein